MTTTNNTNGQKMTTYSEEKAAFSQTLEVVKTRRGTTISAPVDFLWRKHITGIVVGSEKFAACDGVDSLEFSEVMTALPNMGGIITESPDGLRVSVQVAQNLLSPWVLIELESEHVAVTVKEAFERGKNESVWPEKAVALEKV